jgi:Cu+-exporting ATPase
VVQENARCYHCGQRCDDEQLVDDDKTFCCYGCQVVYEIIRESNLCAYYDYESHPGATARPVDNEAYAMLDEKAVQETVLEFQSPQFARVRFPVPSIHCVSCVWLLENLHKLEPGVLRSEVNFPAKSVVVDFHPERTSLRRIASRMASVGYPPQIRLKSDNAMPSNNSRQLLFRLAVAGFCFGNVMLFSFPEYLGLDEGDELLRLVFSWLNVALALPVLVFSASDYFKSAVQSFNQRQINIDVPIAVGLIALFARSLWDIASGFGPGYLDSFTGLVFFLLVGRWFQGKTYESLAFDRDFRAYFPLAIRRWVDGSWSATLIRELGPGDRIQVRNMEIVPTDCVLKDEPVYIDYSFVSGESRPSKAMPGDRVFAGGRVIGQPATFIVARKTMQSHLTSLWNHEIFRKRDENQHQRAIDRAARGFTWAVLMIAGATAAFWYFRDPGAMWLVMTSVLMVACPCALALAAPFTFGSMVRAFGQRQFYLKNADVVERLASIDTVLFDKTGTVTYGSEPEVTWVGDLSDAELCAVKQLTGFSTHPLSQIVAKAAGAYTSCEVQSFRELPGKGVEGKMDGRMIAVGSALFVGAPQGDDHQTRVWVAVDGEVRGYFRIGTSIRPGLRDMILNLGVKRVALLSGDSDGERATMARLFGQKADLEFGKDPHEKRAFVEDLQRSGHRVLMVGDGLNDAGALKQSDVGVSVTDDTGVFSPACDGILMGSQVQDLDKFIRLARRSTAILKTAFIISFVYNGVALSFAVSGHLTPLVAAILMPVSSISVVTFASLAVRWTAWKELDRD